MGSANLLVKDSMLEVILASYMIRLASIDGTYCGFPTRPNSPKLVLLLRFD